MTRAQRIVLVLAAGAVVAAYLLTPPVYVGPTGVLLSEPGHLRLAATANIRSLVSMVVVILATAALLYRAVGGLAPHKRDDRKE